MDCGWLYWQQKADQYDMVVMDAGSVHAMI